MRLFIDFGKLVSSFSFNEIFILIWLVWIDHLVDQHSDDISLISTALTVFLTLSKCVTISCWFQIYSFASAYHELLSDDYEKLKNNYDTLKSLFKNQLLGKRHHPRFVIIKRFAKQIEVITGEQKNCPIRKRWLLPRCLQWSLINL